jgi:hypothetical protein
VLLYDVLLLQARCRRHDALLVDFGMSSDRAELVLQQLVVTVKALRDYY